MGSMLFVEIFAVPYNEEWKKNKKFAVTTLRSYGFGTVNGEGKILDQIDHMATVINNNRSNPIDPDELCKKAAICVIFGIVVGKNFTYDDPELKRLLEVIDDFMKIFAEKEYATLDNYPAWLSNLLIPG